MNIKSENIDYIKLVRLKERYRVLSELNASPNSKHKMHIRINKLLSETLNEILNYEQ